MIDFPPASVPSNVVYWGGESGKPVLDLRFAAFGPDRTSTGLPVPLFDKYDTAANSGGIMIRRASIGIALLALSHLAFANASLVLAQAGSVGGTIGNQDKTISGGEESDRPRAATPRRKEVKAQHQRSAPIKSASESPKPQSTETPQAKFADAPTCSNVRAACEKTASKFGIRPGQGHCASSFAECMLTGKWKSSFSYYEGLARR